MHEGIYFSASLSRNLQTEESMPTLIHSLVEQRSSVLSLAATSRYIFSGSQNEDIVVWDNDTFTLKKTLHGHTGSVLALEYAKDNEWLFSSSGDSTVRVWSTITLEPLYLITPYQDTAAGDLFSLAWLPSLQTIFIGCQNTSLQWLNFNDAITRSQSNASLESTGSSSSGVSTPSKSTSQRQAHKFFDSYPLHERRPADIFARNTGSSRIGGRGSPESDLSLTLISAQSHLEIPSQNVFDSAHYGYIYCITPLHPAENAKEPRIATGSGDETVKIWKCQSVGPTLEHQFELNHGAILAIVAHGDTIFAGCQDGYVKVLDLETKTLIRTIIVAEGIDILSMSMLNSDLFTCSADGWVKRWSASFDCIAGWQAHKGIVLSSVVTKRGIGSELVTGGNDSQIKVWDAIPSTQSISHEVQNSPCIGPHATDIMTYALSKFIAIPSVSSIPSHREDCRQAGIWLRKCLGQLGATTSLLPTGEGINPLVLATFAGTVTGHRKPRILFYGHYDVIAAPQQGWDSKPFVMTGKNGYLYGRGVTDNKGPIISIACAAAHLLSHRALGVDLVFLVEGEEECGSLGFREAVRQHKESIGHIDAILVSNSTWITDERPCITYGLRGVIHCGLEISSNRPDLHSGIEGGGVSEPMVDMVKLLATLTDNKNLVQIPGFYDSVRPENEDEKENFKLLSQITHKPAASLESRWREPSLTIHTVEVSGPKNATVIPGTVKAQISLRIVPDQDINVTTQSLIDYLKKVFQGFQSPNDLQTSVNHSADWWLGNLDDPWFKALESAVREEWGKEPLRIREGGSIPSVPYLEKEFHCHALHLPMGQASDQAHLPNERISLNNLNKGRAVVQRFLQKIADDAFRDHLQPVPP
ncbi:glutathione degradosome [Coprinopsis marcescibilis]|uniref:Glutathione degradosome n=1 Tax=Coprinopsis marcescibilis TaxID=230819 RepID=A0A5C3KIY0_COPMA|nr:glutathione degradosome [Coprinopsis marcescibilis]